jgi:very-short-patch-repair endonuclease
VFSSFDSSMIDLGRTSATAIEHLKHYLEFAERGPVALSEQSTAAYGVDQFDSDFEQAVAWALRDLGWKVQTQIGVSKFRVDLGIVHPDSSGLYLAGIECDGATYHSSPNARDRDRTRHAILENLGWRLIRLWSTDYFRDPDSAIQKIHNELMEILEADRERSSAEPEPEDFVEVSVDLESYFEAPADNEALNQDGEEQLAEGATYPASVYFEGGHVPRLIEMAKVILTERPCITQRALALEIANQHGLSRTSRKQLLHLLPLIDSWAGIGKYGDNEPVYWLSPKDITKVLSWRGLSPFGYDRDWKEIALPEAIGLALEAVKCAPANPVDYICNTFGLKRRHSTTLEVFQSWVDMAGASSSNTPADLGGS